jgi:hypothetical protein
MKLIIVHTRNEGTKPDRSGWDANHDQKADEWIALLTACDLDDADELEAIVTRVPPALLPRIRERGGPKIREKLLMPALRRAEDAGVVEWTGRHDADGLRIWRSLIDNATPPALRRIEEGRRP